MESKIIATNKKAFQNYFLLERWECGIILKGSEVKSLRSSGVNFTDSFAHVEGSEILLYNLHINSYVQASYLNVEPVRPRKLLLHKREISKIAGQVQKGLTLIPTKIYFNKRGFAKVEIALGKSKKLHDRREDIKKRDVDREMKRAQHTHQKNR